MLHTHHLTHIILWKAVTKTELSIITVNLMIVHEMIGSMIVKETPLLKGGLGSRLIMPWSSCKLKTQKNSYL